MHHDMTPSLSNLLESVPFENGAYLAARQHPKFTQSSPLFVSRENLREALELFFECASPDEIHQRLGEEVFVTHVEVTIG